ncbi:hypothetical protein [Trichothermofontia sp.]
MPCVFLSRLGRIRGVAAITSFLFLLGTPPAPTIAAETPGDRPFPPPPAHLSGASLLFVIWLVADQVSTDLYETLRPDSGHSEAAESLPAYPNSDDEALRTELSAAPHP